MKADARRENEKLERQLKGISVIAALAVLPMAANAEVGDREEVLCGASGHNSQQDDENDDGIVGHEFLEIKFLFHE